MSLVKTSSDIYGEDKPCRVIHSESEIIGVTRQDSIGAESEPIDIIFPYDTDIAVGWVVDVKETMVRNGAVTTVETTLREIASSGDTSVTVNDATGFRVGQEISIYEGSNHDRVRIRDVDQNTIYFYDTAKDAIEYSFTTSATVVADTYYTVIMRKRPEIKEWKLVAARQMANVRVN